MGWATKIAYAILLTTGAVTMNFVLTPLLSAWFHLTFLQGWAVSGIGAIAIVVTVLALLGLHQHWK